MNISNDINTYDVVENYINHSLNKNNLDNLKERNNKINNAITYICDNFASMHHNKFNTTIINDAFINDKVLTYANIKEMYDEIVNNLFYDNKYHWGRLIALFVFSGELVCKYYHEVGNRLREYIINWTSTYIQIKCKPWIDENNGWDGFLVTFKDELNRRDELNCCYRDGNKNNNKLLVLLAVFTLGFAIFVR